MKINKPWGSYKTLLDLKFLKIKIITVNPESRLSLQSHKFRSEIWISRQLFFDDVTPIFNSSRIKINFHYIPKNKKHRLMNILNSKLDILEIQFGLNCIEEDIIRYEDDYLRV